MANIKETIRAISEELYGNGKLDLVDRYYHEDYVNHDPPQGFSPDRQGVRDFVQTLHTGLSNVESETTHVILEGDLGAARWTVSAVHTGELFGIPATNRTLNVSGICIYRLQDGRVVEEWQQQDNLGLLQQLGAVPEMA